MLHSVDCCAGLRSPSTRSAQRPARCRCERQSAGRRATPRRTTEQANAAHCRFAALDATSELAGDERATAAQRRRQQSERDGAATRGRRQRCFSCKGAFCRESQQLEQPNGELRVQAASGRRETRQCTVTRQVLHGALPTSDRLDLVAKTF
jgi:hypothetical protein